MIKRTFLLSLALTGALGGLAVAARQGTTPLAADTSYVVVRPQRLLEQSVPGKALLAKAQSFQQQKAVELKARQQALEAIRKELAAAADPARRTQLQLQESTQRTDFERATLQAQNELQVLQRQISIELQAQTVVVLDKLLEGSKVNLVLNGDSAVVWGRSSTDITPAVIERLNATAK